MWNDRRQVRARALGGFWLRRGKDNSWQRNRCPCGYCPLVDYAVSNLLRTFSTFRTGFTGYLLKGIQIAFSILLSCLKFPEGQRYRKLQELNRPLVVVAPDERYEVLGSIGRNREARKRSILINSKFWGEIRRALPPATR